MTVKEREAQYKARQEEKKAHIRLEPNKFKRFLKWIWFYTAFPFIWIWENIKDFRTFIIFFIVLLLVSSEVWVQ